jgi:hypothetical protein
MRAIKICLLAAHSSDKKVLLLPPALYAERPLDHIRKGAAGMLSSRLAGGELAVISGDMIEGSLTEEEKKGITSEKRAEEIMRELGADYAVFGSITAIGSSYSLDFSLLESKEGLPPMRFSAVMAEDQFIPQLSDMANQMRSAIERKGILLTQPTKPSVLPETTIAQGIFPKSEGDRARSPDREQGIAFKSTQESRPLKPTGTIPFAMEVMSFDMGDLDGDGTVELVLVDRKKMLVYRREGTSFMLIDTLKASWGEEFFKVSVGDVDNNGTAEIYVVGLHGMRARTSVYERAKEIKRLERKTGHIRVIKDPIENKSILLFQGSKANEFFSGPLYSMNYDDKGNLIKGEQLPEMKGAQFYTLMRSDIDTYGNRGWFGFGEAGLSEQSKLHLWGEQGELLWRGEEDLGGTNNAIRVGERKSPDAQPPRVSFNSRLVFADINGNGKREVVTLSNTPLIKHTQDLKLYTKSRLIAYERQGSEFLPGWITGEIDYCITELQVYRQGLFLAAHKGKISNIGKKSGVIMLFE